MIRMNYQEALNYLYNSLPVFHNIGSKAYKPGLDNTIKLMEALDHPYKKYRTIHIAGTNGKGSVSNFLAAVLQTAGYKTGLYTSPHLVDFGERIRVDGKMIERQYLVDFIEKHKSTLEDIKPSFFETTMAMAFDYFAYCEVDIAIIEVGLGGRLDSTNIIRPILSVITNISFDHTAFLGDNLTEIAAEKAGIIKEQTPVVVGEYLPETKNVFEEKAKKENAPIRFVEDELELEFVASENEKILLKSSKNEIYKIGLVGNYQLKNAATAIIAVDELLKTGVFISDQDLKKGLEHVVEITGLQGRWQKLNEQPLVITDTGHNAAGIRFVAEQLSAAKYNKLRIVIGMVEDKDVSTVLKLLPASAVYYFTQANVSRALSSQKLFEKANNEGLKAYFYSSVSAAVEQAMADASPDDLIFIGGSNFVVGEAIPFFKK